MVVGLGLAEYQAEAIARATTARSGSMAAHFGLIASSAKSWANFVHRVMIETTAASSLFASTQSISRLSRSSAIKSSGPNATGVKISFVGSKQIDEYILARLESKREELTHIWLDEAPDLWGYRIWQRRQRPIPEELLVDVLPIPPRSAFLQSGAGWHHVVDLDRTNVGYVTVTRAVWAVLSPDGLLGQVEKYSGEFEREIGRSARASENAPAADRERNMLNGWALMETYRRR